MGQALEIIAAPFTIYLAPVGEAFPAVDAAPAGNWVRIGASGDKNYTEEGVTVQHPQTVELFRMAGSTGPRAASRTEEGLILGFSLADIRPAVYKYVLNDQTVTEVGAGSGTPGYDSIPLLRGINVAEHALLARGPSPLLAAGNAQYEVPRVIHTGEIEVIYAKDAPAALLFEFNALEDVTDDTLPFGRLVAQDEVAA